MIWIILIGLMLTAWFLQNILHETSHLVMGYFVEGRRPTLLIPWPHIFRGRLYFSRYDSGPATKLGSAFFRHSSPIYICFIQNITINILYWFILPAKTSIYLMPFLIAFVVDTLVWLWGYYMRRPGTDGEMVREIMESYNG
jgi:hypothetical protein